MDIIEIKNLRLRCQIGFSPHEIGDIQDVVINLRLGTQQRRGGESDLPDDTFNYKTVTKALIRHVEASKYFLVEKLAEEIARICVIDCGAPYVQVSVHKPGALRYSDSVGISIERRPDDFAQTIAYISLGSNIDPEKNLVQAVKLLRQYTTLLQVSPVYRTSPQGYSEQADFLNMAVKIHSYRSPLEFKTQVIERIESDLGRVRDPQNKNAPRTIDLDISLWNDEIIDYGDKPHKIPDKDIVRFAHVAIPLADIAPDYVHPIENKSLAEIAQGLNRDGMQRIELDLGL